MPTGACGINCDVCRLNVIGVCSSCGAGTSVEGAEKPTFRFDYSGSLVPYWAARG